MPDKESIRILTISLNAWNDMMPTGNTFSNLFSGIPSENISNIYCRNERIANDVCRHYFCVTEADIFRNLFTKERCGRQVEPARQNGVSTAASTAPSRIKNQCKRLFQKFRPTVLLFIRELIWDTCVWKNKKLCGFVKQFNPDIIYMHAHYNLYMHRVLSYCEKLANAKVAVFFGDDMYSYKSRYPFQLVYQAMLRKRLRKTVAHASVLFGATKQLCDEYEEIFDRHFVALYKSCSLPEAFHKTGYNTPLRFIYAGNMLYGRDQVLLSLRNAIADSNAANSLKCQLEIFSATIIDQKTAERLNDGQHSFLIGVRPYAEVCEVMSKADVVLHVESWEKKQMKKTRLSFSTKIIDCMQSGSALFAIGPDGIASIRYILDSRCAFCATSENEIPNTIQEIVRTPDLVLDYAKRMRKYAQVYHDVSKVQDGFYNALLLCCKA